MSVGDKIKLDIRRARTGWACALHRMSGGSSLRVMLADRPYLRRAHHTSFWSVTTALLLVNIACFGGQLLAENRGLNYLSWLALQPDKLIQGQVWQLLTFQFLHDTGNWLHIMINGALLWYFGQQIEAFLGRGSMLKLYLLSGVVGGLVQVIISHVFAGVAPTDVAVLGASAGVCGLVAAYCAINWDQKLILWLFLAFPIPARGKYLVLALLFVCGAGMYWGDSNIAHAAHFGGVWMGLVFVRWIVQADRVLNAWEVLRTRIKPRPLIERVEAPEVPYASVEPVGGPSVEDDELAGESEPVSHAEPEPKPELEPDEFMEQEVNPILEKISEHGIDCLTEKERETLEKARELVTGKS